MKLLIIFDDFSGGAGNMAQILALKLKSVGFSISLMLTYMHSEPRYDLQDIRIFNVNLSKLPGSRIFRFGKQIRSVRRVLEQSQCDMVISFLDNNNTTACFAVREKSIPLIVSERSNPLVIYPRFCWRILRKIGYRMADVISVQFEAFKFFEHGIFEQKCMVTHNIIWKAPIIKSKWSEDRVSFVSLGRYDKIKRFDLMIELFAEACLDQNNCELHIFGSGIPNETLKRKIIAHKMECKVFLHNAINNVHEELIRHDVYLMTSYQEGFPNALSEALAVGLPAVAFKCHDGIADLVQNGENGFCVSEGDKDAFVQCIKHVVASCSLRKDFGKKSREIAGKYNEKEVMKEWNMCIEKAIKNKQRT